MLYAFLQDIEGVPKIAEGINPATYALQVPAACCSMRPEAMQMGVGGMHSPCNVQGYHELCLMAGDQPVQGAGSREGLCGRV